MHVRLEVKVMDELNIVILVVLDRIAKNDEVVFCVMHEHTPLMQVPMLVFCVTHDRRVLPDLLSVQNVCPEQ